MILGLKLLPSIALMLFPGVTPSGPSCTVTALNLSVPAQARPATCGPFCDSTQYATENMAGSGSSCAAALSALTSQITAYANGQCRSITGFAACMIEVKHPAVCTMDTPGLYWQIGYGYYHCRDTTC